MQKHMRRELEREPTQKSWSRRSFNRHLLAAAGAALLGLPRAGAHASSLSLGRYVDIHTHLGQRWGDRSPLSAEALLWWMDDNEIAQAAVLPLINPESWDYPITTEYVLEQTRPYRDRLIPFCAIDPRTIHLQGIQPKVEQLKRYTDAGARGFGEHKPGIPIDDPCNLELFAACAEVGLPMLIHIDNLRNMDRPGLPGLEKALRKISDGIFIAHAQGWWASISGGVAQEQMQGYPKTEVAPGGAIDRLMDGYPNLYADLSAGSGANAINRDLSFGREFLIRRADRVLFGTDYLAPGQVVPQLELYHELSLPEEVQEKIFRENARWLLKLT